MQLPVFLCVTATLASDRNMRQSVDDAQDATAPPSSFVQVGARATPWDNAVSESYNKLKTNGDAGMAKDRQAIASMEAHTNNWANHQQNVANQISSTTTSHINSINAQNSAFQTDMASKTTQIKSMRDSAETMQTTVGELVETVMDAEVDGDDAIKQTGQEKVEESGELASQEEDTVLRLAKSSGDEIQNTLKSTKDSLITAIVNSMDAPEELEASSKESKGDFDDAAKETNSANKLGRKEVQTAGKSDRKEMQRVLKDTKNEPAQIHKSLAGIYKDASKELKSEYKDSAREIRSIFKDAQGDMKKAKKEQKTDFKDAFKEEKAINKETLAAGKMITAEEKSNFQEATMNQVEIDGTLMEAAEDAQSAKEQAEFVFQQASGNRQRAERKIQSTANEYTNEAKDYFSQVVTKLDGQLRDDKSATFALRNSAMQAAKSTVQKQLENSESSMKANILQTNLAIQGTLAEAKKLEMDVKSQKAEMGEADRQSEATDLKTQQNEAAVKAVISEARDEISGEINETKANLLKEMADGESKTSQSIADADQWSEDAVNTTEQNLRSAVVSAVAEQTDRLKQVNNSATAAARRIGDTFTNMRTLVDSINQFRDDTYVALPQVQNMTDVAVTKIRSEVDAAETSVKSTQDHLKGVTAQQEAASQRELDTQSAQINSDLKETLDSTQANTDQMIQESTSLYNALVHNVKQDEKEINSFQDAQGLRIKNIYDGATDLSQKVKKEVTKLQSLIGSTEGQMGDTKSYLTKLGFEEGQQVEAAAGKMQQDADARVAAVGQAAAQGAEEAMDSAYTKGSKEQDAEAAKIAAYLGMTLSEVQAMMQTENGMQQLAAKAHAKASSNDESRSAYVSHLTHQMSLTEHSTEDKLKAGRADIAAYGAQFNGQIKNGANSLHNRFQQELKGAQATQQGKEAQLSGGIAMRSSDLKNRVGVWSQNVDDGVGDVQSKLNGLSHKVLGVEAHAGALAGTLGHDADVLQRLGAEGQHQLLLALQRAEQAGDKLSAEELKEMDALAERLLGDRNKKGFELNVLTGEFDQIMQQFHATAKQQVQSAAGQLQRLMQSSPDLAKSFDSQLKETRQSVESTAKDIDAAKDETEADEKTLIERLEQSKASRAKQAEQFKSHVDKTEKQLEDKVSDVKETISDLSSRVQTAKVETDTGIKRFEAQVTELEGTETDHNKDVLDKIDADVSAYQTEHSSLMQWAMANKHQASAWRDAVERELRTLLFSLDENAAAEAGNQLSEEMDMNNAMRDLQKHIEGDSAKSAVSNSAYLTKMLGRTESLVKGAMGDEEEMEGKVLADEHSAESGLSAEESRSKDQVAQLQRNEDEMKGKAQDLDTQLQVVSGQMQSQLVLPMQTASEANVAIDNKLRAQNSILKSMQGRFPEAESFVEIAAGSSKEQIAQAEEGEKAALHKLNSELYRELVEDVRDNRRLEQGLQKMKKKA